MTSPLETSGLRCGQQVSGPAPASHERGAAPAGVNRGPAAAAANRAALLDAARDLFARHGAAVPLSAIARRAGVGQGSLYRHFPTRVDLALAVFEDNLAELGALADRADDAGAFVRLWHRLLDLTLGSVAFIEVAVDAREELVSAGLAERLRALLEAPLDRAQSGGVIPVWLTVDDLALVLRMVYGVVVSEPDPDEARTAVARALGLVHPSLVPDRRPAGAERAAEPTDAERAAGPTHPTPPIRTAHPTQEQP